jgi:hypothetical protein
MHSPLHVSVHLDHLQGAYVILAKVTLLQNYQ